MVRSEITSILSRKIQKKIKKTDIEKILQISLDTIVRAISDDKSCEIRYFGRWRPKKISSRMVRDPRTNKKFIKKKSIGIKFKTSQELQKKINENEAKN